MKKRHARELSRNQSILRFDVILQHHWPIEQCLVHIRVFFGGKTKRACFDLFVHWLIKQITNDTLLTETRSDKNRSILMGNRALCSLYPEDITLARFGKCQSMANAKVRQLLFIVRSKVT